MNAQISTKEKVVSRIGIDLAKNVFQFHGINARGKILFRKTIIRSKVLETMANIQPCLVGMEACGGAHYWGRELEKLGHSVKLMPGKHVKPYRMNNKNDKNDAAAICEAVQRPNIRFVPVKTVEQQDLQSLHVVRQEFIKIRTMQANQIRGLLLEYGIAIPKGISNLRKTIPYLIDDAENNLSTMMRFIMNTLYGFFCEVDNLVKILTEKIEAYAQSNEVCKRLMQIDGFGPIVATAFYSAVGSGKQFSCGRDASAWLGLIPRQNSSGGKSVLLGISKNGNRYLKTLLIHGSRAVVTHAHRKQDIRSKWIQALVLKKGKNKAAVATSNKITRIALAMLRTGEEYRAAA